MLLANKEDAGKALEVTGDGMLRLDIAALTRSLLCTCVMFACPLLSQRQACMYREKIAGVGMNDSKRICSGSGINESTSKRSLSDHSSSSTGRAFSLLRR